MRFGFVFYYDGPRSNNYFWSLHLLPSVELGYGEGINDDQRQFFVGIGFLLWSICVTLTWKIDDERKD